MSVNRACHTKRALSPARKLGFVSLFLLAISGGVLSLFGCSQTPNVTPTPTSPVNGTDTPLITVMPTVTVRPRISKVDLAIEFAPMIDAESENNVYALTVHNLAQELATNIVITHVFPSGTNVDDIRLLEPICQFQEYDMVCDVGDAQADSNMVVTLDLSAASGHPVISEMQRSGLTPHAVLPICSFEQTPDRPLSLKCYLESFKPDAQAQIHIELNPNIKSGVHTFSVAAQQIDPDLSNNAGNVTIAAPPVKPAMLPDLTVLGTGPAQVVAGQPFIYTYLVSNQGTGQATEVTLEDSIPPGLVLNSYAPDFPLCDQNGNTLACSLIDPDSGEKVSVTLDISGNEDEPLQMKVDPLMPGWPVCYMLKEWDHLLLHCDLGTLQPGQSTHVRMEMLAFGVQERSTTNTVAVQASEPDLAPANNINSTSILVQTRADLQIRAAPPEWSVNEKTLTYLIEVQNLGPSAADYSILKGALPAGTRLVSAKLEPGRECQVEPDNTIACNLLYIESGETASLTLVISVEAGLAPQDQAEVFLRSLQAVSKILDPNPGNNVVMGPITISMGEAQ